MKIDPRILGLVAGTVFTASACGGVSHLESGSTSTTASSTSSSSSTTTTSTTDTTSTNTNVVATNDTTGETTDTTGGDQTTNVSISPEPNPESYPPPCGRG